MFLGAELSLDQDHRRQCLLIDATNILRSADTDQDIDTQAKGLFTSVLNATR